MKIGINQIKERTLVFFCSIFFVISLNFSHEVYLYPVQEFWGFSYNALDFSKWGIVIISIALISIFLPLSFKRPSGLILFILYIVVYLPTLIITAGLKPDSISVYGESLLALTLGFFLVCISTRFLRYKLYDNFVGISATIEKYFSIAWWLLFIFLIYNFYGIMNFVGLNEIYSQRALGRSGNLFEAYAQTYFAYVISPALLAFGLLRKKYKYIVLGLVGFLVMFMITAERSIFLMPFFIVFLFLMLRTNISHPNLMAIALGISGLIIVSSSLFFDQNPIFKLIALYLVFRIFAVPGLMFSQYQEVFSSGGHTFWSNVSGISFFSQVPEQYVGEANWPQLGYIVADRVLGVNSNSNANFFAYDGIAAAGTVGIYIICLLLAMWLLVLDRAAKNIDYKFFSLILFPVGFLLTNGSLFSILLSFGGLFWIVVFLLLRFLDSDRRSAINVSKL